MHAMRSGFLATRVDARRGARLQVCGLLRSTRKAADATPAANAQGDPCVRSHNAHCTGVRRTITLVRASSVRYCACDAIAHGLRDAAHGA
jgi:hypothetical protein